MANRPSSTITRKMDLTTELVVCSPSDSALPLTLRPSAQATTPIASAMNGALIMPTLKCVTEIASLQAGNEDLRVHAAIQPGDQPAAVQRGHGSEERQKRQSDDQGDDPRQQQDRHGIEPHGAQRVDLLAHLHGTELGGVGAARAAGHHDRNDQHADLAQHQDADHVDHVFVGAELAEVEEALLGDDAADQEGDEQDDRHRLPGDAVEVVHGGRDTKGPRPHQHRNESMRQGAQHVQEHDKVAAKIGDAAPNLLQGRREQVRIGRLGWRFAIGGAHLCKQPVVAGRQVEDAQVRSARLPGAHEALQQPRAIGVELLHRAQVDGRRTAGQSIARYGLDQQLQLPRVYRRPGTASRQLDAAVGRDAAQLRGMAQGGHSMAGESETTKPDASPVRRP